MFDAVAIILSDEAAALLGKEAAAIDFVRDAFGHLKAIGVDKGGEALLKTAAIEQDAGVIAIDTLDRFYCRSQDPSVGPGGEHQNTRLMQSL